MSIVLQVLGALTLVFFVFVVVLILVVRSKLKRFFKKLEGMAQNITAPNVPARLHLRTMAAPSWENAEAVAGQVESLPALGFVEGGTYQVEELPGFTLQAWFQLPRAVTAVVYEHPKAGVWTDLVTRYRDGTSATFHNRTGGVGVDHSPGHTIENFPNVNTREIYEHFLDRRPDRPAVVPTADEFVERFEKAYADEMDWRNSRGGATAEEIRRMAQLSGTTIDEETIEAVRNQSRERAAAQLDEAIRERFLAETSLSAAEWEKIRDRLVIIHDQMAQESFDEALLTGADEVDQDGETPVLDGTPATSARRLFAEHNQRVPSRFRCEQIGAVQQPIEADVYVVPASL